MPEQASATKIRPVVVLAAGSGGARKNGFATTGLPDDVQRESVGRLRVVALLYAVVFFASDLLGYVVDPNESIDSIDDWLFGALSIGCALTVAFVTTRRTLPSATIMAVGVVFEVVGSLGIALAEYWGVYRGLEYQPEHLDIAGMSWVAIWMMLYTVVVPARPRTALVAASLSAATVPIVFALSVWFDQTSIVLTPIDFFGALVLPYAMVVLMAYVGARVIYRLGAEVTKARRMGSYELVEKMGQGGMGEVWGAEHRLLARPAVVKLIRPDLLAGGIADGSDVVIERFTREAHATSSLRSPHTVDLYDFGVADDGTFYYVMERLDGFDLDEMIRLFGPVPAERVIHLLKQVCHSLSEAHENGLVHRDIKPSNIFACRYGREVDFVKVLDFGLVKASQQDEDATALTADDVITGTPAFLAPEQASGGRPVDGRSDLYALGCVAYWLLTGKLVFKGGTVMRTMVMHMREEPVPPSQRTDVEVPEMLEKIVLRCLEKDPDKRPQSADELLGDLLECETKQGWSPERARRWWQETRPASDAPEIAYLSTITRATHGVAESDQV